VVCPCYLFLWWNKIEKFHIHTYTHNITLTYTTCDCSLFRYLITHLLNHSWSWSLLEKLPIVQLLKNFPAFYGTRRFVTVFTRALHWSLSWARSIQSIPVHPISLRSILILSTHLRLGLPSGLFHSGFPTNILYAFVFSPIRATCPAHLILLDLIVLIILGEEYKIWRWLPYMKA
jgi:hypothetical protein